MLGLDRTGITRTEIGERLVNGDVMRVEALRLLNRTVWDLEFVARGLADDIGPEAWDRARDRDSEWKPPWV